MSTIERIARNLLADQKEPGSVGERALRGDVKIPAGSCDDQAVKAIIAALTPPEGWVLMPINPTVDMRGAFKGTFPHETHKALHFGDFDVRYAAMLAARPEVKP